MKDKGKCILKKQMSIKISIFIWKAVLYIEIIFT